LPTIKADEIRDMSNENREKMLQEYRTELIKIKTMVNAGGSIENPSRSKYLKKGIARILTVMNEKEE
jgi:large subunit ribosomal protein L29